MKDLFILVADGDMKETFEGLTKRVPTTNSEIRTFSYRVEKHNLHDAGCLNHSAGFMRPLRGEYERCLVVLDFEGSGAESYSPELIENRIKEDLERNGWEGDCEAIVIDPELEQWMWATSPKVASAIGWGETRVELDAWLRENEFLKEGALKPNPPKEAFEAALRKKRIPWSSSIFRKISETASYRDCEEPSFLRFLEILRSWFPAV